jgi:hypothetical protein
MTFSKNLRLLLGASLIACTFSALAAESLHVELNKLEPQDAACRAYLVFDNQTPHSFSGLTLDMVMFDKEGVISKQLAIDAAPLPVDKTSVKVFDIDGLSCDNIGRILVNDVFDCQDESGERKDCVALIKPASRSEVPLIK